ncbi:hypothetical protein Tco_0370681 [Tanacetum coccineum]
MASCGSDWDAKDALSKLLQIGTVAKYRNEFEKLINRVTGISQSLLTSFYIFGLKLELQRELWRSRPTTLGEAFSLARPTTLGEAFSLARIVEARVTDIPDSLLISSNISRLKLNLQHELLVSRPTTLGDAFSLARITETRPLDASEDTLLSLRSENLNFKIQKKAVEYVRALNVAPLEVVFAGPVDEFRGKFAEFSEDKGCVEKILSATKLSEGGNSHSTYSPYHLEGKVNFEGVGNVKPWAADIERKKRVLCYVQGSGRRKRKKGYWSRKAVRDGLG